MVLKIYVLEGIMILVGFAPIQGHNKDNVYPSDS